MNSERHHRGFATAGLGSILLLVLFAATARADSVEIADRETMFPFVRTMLANGQYEPLETLGATLRSEKQRFDDGLWKLSRFYASFEDVSQKVVDAPLETSRETLERWRRERPASSTPQVAMAHFLIGAAVKARGQKWSSETSREAWDQYADFMSQARAVLEASREVCAKDPGWYEGLMRVALAQQWDADAREKLFQNAVAVEPTYDALYITTAAFRTPRWGGSFEELRALAKRAVGLTRATDGDVFYARIYWVAAMTEGTDHIRSGELPWDDMKRGFLDLDRRWPKSIRNANAFARFACAMKDKDAARPQVTKVGTRWERDVWYTNDAFESCKAWALGE